VPADLKSWSELPLAGALAPAETVQPHTGEWRTEGRPLPHYATCVNCLLCWLYCPDSAVILDRTTFAGIDYDYCKGCALCVEVCPTGALTMEPEPKAVS
jgi:2-oxoacid:acceptor oxidoreductase delta subunit (pyruvate/2-ketoisovalerate family)